jgi:hypothetical protein
MINTDDFRLADTRRKWMSPEEDMRSPLLDADGDVLTEFVQAVLQTAKGKPQPNA